MRSKLWTLPRPLGRFAGALRLLWAASVRDQVTLRAAEASFFLITSAVPFLSLLLSLTGALLPEDTDALVDRLPLSGDLAAAFRYLAEEVSEAPGVPLLSVSAAATLWSASRGISSVRRGLSTVFGIRREGNPVARRLKPVFATLAAAVASASFLLTLNGSVFGVLPEIPEPAGILTGFGLLTAVTALIYRTAGGSGGILRGAVFSAAGWILLSRLPPTGRLGPDGSFVWGAFAAVTLLMLRLYLGMILLLLGAEIARKTVDSATKEANRRG